MALIRYQQSVIPACDVADLQHLARIVEATGYVQGIGAYKVGLELALRFGLPATVRVIRSYSDLPIIYDHQKAGNDIPGMGPHFARAVKDAGADAVILFPFVGPATERAWIDDCMKVGLTVLVGGHMTHKEFADYEGGFITLDHAGSIYTTAILHGVRDFVVPGNNPDLVDRYRRMIQTCIQDEFRLYAPGFISQGGDITKAGKVAGDRWHAIVGRALYDHPTIRQIHEAAQKLTAEIIGNV